MVQKHSLSSAPGTVALLGSGEYLPVMNETDTYLLATLGGAGQTHIALLPTASGLEPGRPQYWNSLGFEHFQKLGVQDIRLSSIIDHTGSNDPEQVALLQGANFYYFSGGNPRHILESLRATTAWEVIAAAYRRGAILAGCSAGAMALGSVLISPRDVYSDQSPHWLPGLGIVPKIAVFPHFDRMQGNEIWASGFKRMLASLPEDHRGLGIDEDTALVRMPVETEAEPASWKVMGLGSVTLFERDGRARIFHVGETIVDL
ncbi:Type 1 glutamine amidotransferase-like domain-containing protein [Dictyobacter aurantiacus]|uniref:Peptidase n=1 Tax=Dictyobacter aurantiacus TaxID=1936993 RepID=A0A401ZPS4_9CHLR|nr:Type 1 glutamine amidotransferase-like domain-containing protein [Dictyobacter aurantiacus]GCE08861.1 hypothetical protein KDAU_61900 [Dictyobacter aurantiacus]